MNSLLVKQTFIVTLLSLLVTVSSPAMAWGKNGHRIIGHVAQSHLTPSTQHALDELLNGDSLAEIGNWADEMRSNPSPFWQKKSSRWHYINIDNLKQFKHTHYKPARKKKSVSNAYTAILTAIEKLKNKKTSREEKQFYLRFLVHLIGDIHQPLHVGYGKDRGGNKTKVMFFGELTNLHRLWDSQLIDYEKLSYTEFAHFINTQDPQKLQLLAQGNIQDWFIESHKIVTKLYKNKSKEYGYSYIYNHMPIVKEQLLRGGVRLAVLLNALFDDDNQHTLGNK